MLWIRFIIIILIFFEVSLIDVSILPDSRCIPYMYYTDTVRSAKIGQNCSWILYGIVPHQWIEEKKAMYSNSKKTYITQKYWQIHHWKRAFCIEIANFDIFIRSQSNGTVQHCTDSRASYSQIKIFLYLSHFCVEMITNRNAHLNTYTHSLATYYICRLVTPCQIIYKNNVNVFFFNFYFAFTFR